MEDDEPAPELSELVLTIEAGERITIGAVTVLGTPLEPEAEVIRSLGLPPGRPFDQVAIEARIAGYEESLRQRGYYQARVRESHSIAADGRSMSVTVTVAPGPHVSIVFAGDPLPQGYREGLIPIRAETGDRPGPARGCERGDRECAAGAGFPRRAGPLYARGEER